MNKVICGDNCEVLRSLEFDSVDLVVTSPPYDGLRDYKGAKWDFYGVAWLLSKLVKDGGIIVWNVADATFASDETGSSFKQALHFKSLGLRLVDTMIYQKQNYLPQTAFGRYDQTFEYCFIFSKGEIKTFNGLKDRPNRRAGLVQTTRKGTLATGEADRFTTITSAEFGLRGNVWSYPTGGYNCDHPAQMPEEMAKDFISTWSNAGDLVLDPFAGSGTTLRAAKDLNRRFLGVEINPEYVAICNNRLAQEVLNLE